MNLIDLANKITKALLPDLYGKPGLSTEQVVVLMGTRELVLRVINENITDLTAPIPKDNEVDEKVIWSDDLAAVLEAASEASAVPLTWFANREFSPEQTKAWLCDAVDNTVEGGTFSGELHSIAEEDSGLTVAFTGCGPKSGANAKFLIWCAHFILKHRDSLSDHAATVAELRAEVESERKLRLRAEGLCSQWITRHDFALESLNELTADRNAQRDRADAAERRVGELGSLLSDTVGNLHRMGNSEFADCDQERLDIVISRIERTLSGADPT